MNIRTTSIIMRAAVTLLLLATCTVLQARQNPKFAWTTQLFLEQQRQEQQVAGPDRAPERRVAPRRASQVIASPDTVFSYTYQGQTLYYIIDSTNNAMLVAPMWPTYDKTTDDPWFGYQKPTGAVVVPDSVPFGGTMHAVKQVAGDAFYRCYDVTSFTLPDSITAIGSYAFGRLIPSFSERSRTLSVAFSMFFLRSLKWAYKCHQPNTSLYGGIAVFT